MGFVVCSSFLLKTVVRVRFVYDFHKKCHSMIQTTEIGCTITRSGSRREAE